MQWPRKIAGVDDALGELLGSLRRDVQMLGTELVGPFDRLLGVAHQHQGGESFETGAGQLAPLQGG